MRIETPYLAYHNSLKINITRNKKNNKKRKKIKKKN